MILKNDMEVQGAILFARRSFVPFAILPLAVLAGFASPGFADGHTGLPGRLYDLFCILLSFSGLALRAYTVGTAAPRTSGRNTREQRADSLNTTGVYSIMRNPLYVANFIVFLGMLLFVKEWWLVVIATLAYVMYYERIVMTEERYLLEKFDEEYSAWADRTPVMIPRLSQWTRPARPPVLRTMLRREYNGFYLIVAGFYLLEWCDRLLFSRDTGTPMTIAQAPGMYWSLFFIAGTLVFVTLRSLKKYTGILNDGR